MINYQDAADIWHSTSARSLSAADKLCNY